MNPDTEIPAGIYIHIPFCEKKCFYCDFYSVTDISQIPLFMVALKKEIQMVSRVSLVFDTLYIGGGTPSVLDADLVAQIIGFAFKYFKILPEPEVTMEVNPGTVTLEDLTNYRNSGVNRLNIGVQSFHAENLKWLDRIHSAEQALLSLDWARQAGFDNVGLDLIYGLPAQTENNWLEDLERAVDLHPEHLSCYMLTRESGTPLDKEVSAGRIRWAGDNTLRGLFETTIDYLTRHGFLHYEVSNFARFTEADGSAWKSRHNSKYWSFAPYIGLGPSAHSFIEPERCWNHKSVQNYIRELQDGRLPVADREKLTREQLLMESIYLGFRTTKGIDLVRLKDKFGIDFLKHFHEMIADFEKKGFLKVTKTHCALTVKGMALLDSITAAFTNQDIC
ncbi:MAG: radical SAM family heme chaperone HemW [Desulfobacterales bacterium]|nr:MAG: radical SAM family heme chaperone HemW [Desulfobacterales bacterium]